MRIVKGCAPPVFSMTKEEVNCETVVNGSGTGRTGGRLQCDGEVLAGAGAEHSTIIHIRDCEDQSLMFPNGFCVIDKMTALFGIPWEVSGGTALLSSAQFLCRYHAP